MATTWNPSDKSGGVTLSNGNLTAEVGFTVWEGCRAITSKASGKWYWEISIVNRGDHAEKNAVAVANSSASLGQEPGYTANGWEYRSDGQKNHSNSIESYGDTFTTGDIISVALDLDNGKIWWAKNGTWQNGGDPAAGTGEAYSGVSGTLFPMFAGGRYAKDTAIFDENDFTYTPPTGFFGLDETSTTTELEDVSLDLSAYYQSLEDFATWLRAHDGLEFEDLVTSLEAAGWTTEDLASYLSAWYQSLEDAGLSLVTWGTEHEHLGSWLAAYYRSLEDAKTNLSIVATVYEHWKTFLWAAATERVDLSSILQAYGRELQDLPSFLRAVGYRTEDLNGYFEAVSPTVLASLGLFLTVTDGLTLSNLAVNLTAIKKAPQFKSAVAQRLSSVISEVA